VLGIRIQIRIWSDPDIFVGSGNFDPPKGAIAYYRYQYRVTNVIFSHEHFQYFSFTANPEKNFRNFGQNYLKQLYFEQFTKSGEFYSLGRIRIGDPVFLEVLCGLKWTGCANTCRPHRQTRIISKSQYRICVFD
jgi:hypothetical protein